MKMPGNQTSDSGIYDYEENPYFSDELDNNVEEFTPAPETDFSEYLWMEHEEEFDKEVKILILFSFLRVINDIFLQLGDAATGRRGSDGRMYRSFYEWWK